jgi:AraC-like DNA-binding protein
MFTKKQQDMLELTRIDAPHKPSPNTNICLTLNEQQVHGLHFMHNHRLLVFERSGGSIFIDFEEETIEAGVIYLIPALHFSSLSPAYKGNFLSIELNELVLTPPLKKLIYGLAYQKQKHIPSLLIKDHSLLIKIIETGKQEGDQGISFWKFMAKCFPQELLAELCNYRTITTHYLEDAENLLDILKNTMLSHQETTAGYLRGELGLHERTLRRVCIHIFGLSLNHIIHYHLIQKARYLMSKSIPFADIAVNMGFQDVTSYRRYLKTLTGNKPGQMKELLIKQSPQFA